MNNYVFARDGWQCRHCKDRNSLHQHHIVFRSQGGPDTPNNLITVCAQCHRALHDKKLQIGLVDWTADDNPIVHWIRLDGWQPR